MQEYLCTKIPFLSMDIFNVSIYVSETKQIMIYVNLGLDRMDFGIDDLKVGLRTLVEFKYQNLPPQLLKN